MKSRRVCDDIRATQLAGQAFEIVQREAIRSVFTLGIMIGIEWGCYQLWGADTAWTIGLVIIPATIFGVPMMFAEGVRGGITFLLMGRIGEKFLGFGPEPNDTSQETNSSENRPDN